MEFLCSQLERACLSHIGNKLVQQKFIIGLPIALLSIWSILLASPSTIAKLYTQELTPTTFMQFVPIINQERAVSPTVTPTAPTFNRRATWSAPLALDPAHNTLWVVNPDAGTVSQIDTVQLTTTAEITVGGEPWSLAIAPDGETIYIADRAAGTLVFVDALSRQVAMTLTVGTELGGVALSPNGTFAYLTSTAADEVVTVDLNKRQVTERIPVAYMPYAIAVSNDGDSDDTDETRYITHLFARQRAGGREATDDGREGLISRIEPAATALLNGTTPSIKELPLPPDETGFPNLLTGIALDGRRAWIPTVRAAPALPNGLTTRVFAAVSVLDTADDQGAEPTYLPLNDQELFGSPVNNPIAAIPAPDGDRLYIVLAGSDLIEVVNIVDPEQPQLEAFIAVGKNPRGMALDATGHRGYVMNYLSRSVSVLNLTKNEVVAEIPTAAETLSAAELRGKVLFNNAVNPKLSQGSWISCASCHPDGGTDSVTWIFPDGPRQTPPLWNAAQTLPWHWSAALDEPQDVEETIHVIQLGLGLAPGTDPPQLGTRNAGRSADLDALAIYMQNGIRSPNLPTNLHREAGRTLFTTQGCVDCHGGKAWTTSRLAGPVGSLDADGNGMIDDQLHDVGTVNSQDIRGATGFDVPTLLNIQLSAPYFHDGSIPSLSALVSSGHPQPGTSTVSLTPSEVTALVNFLESIGPMTTPVLQNPPTP